MQQLSIVPGPIEDDTEGFANQFRPRLRLSRRAVGQPEHRLGFKLASEFLTTSLFITVTASMVSARKQARIIRLGADASVYLPKEPDFFCSAATADPAAFFNQSLTAHLQRIYQQLTMALEFTPVRTEHWTTNIVLPGLGWDELCNIWQPLCGEARMLMLVLAELDMLRESDQLPRLLEIEALAKSARYGGTPCVRSDGLVLIPGWLDRRRDRRIPVRVSVVIDYGRGRQRAILSDVSGAGIGVSSCPSLPSGTSMSVELPNGRILNGLVAWSSGGNIGLRFAEPMRETDPLFRSIIDLRRTQGSEWVD
jgi:PilZ domain